MINSPMELYFNAVTQTLVICSQEYALVLVNASQHSDILSTNHHLHNHSNHSSTNQKDVTLPLCVIQFLPRNSVPLSNFKKIQKDLYGCLGLISLKGRTYVGFISGYQDIGPITPRKYVKRLINTVFVNFSGEVFTLSSNLPPSQFDEFNDSTESQSPTSRINSIMKLLETGTFYYSYDTDLSVKMQELDLSNQVNNGSYYTNIQNLQDDYAGRFIWNGNLINELSLFRGRLAIDEKESFDKGGFYLTLIRGFVRCEVLQQNPPCCISIISRQDCRKIGHLFGPSCMDDEGNVANFVETEIIFYKNDSIVSFAIVKGNIPLFWKLDSHLLSTKIEFPRSDDSSKHAFNRFFESLCTEYNMVFVLEALSSKGCQPELSEKYSNALKELQNDHSELSIGYKKLKYAVSLGSKLRNKSDFITLLLQDEQIHTVLENYSVYKFDFNEKIQTSKQLGVFLINTLDSIARSNHIESKISEMILEHIFGDEFTPQIWNAHGILWSTNGAALGKLSETYNTSFKTKNKTGGLIGKFAEQSKKYAEQSKNYVSSGSNSNSGRQTQFDRLLGRKNKEVQVELLDPIHDYFLEILEERKFEFINKRDLSIFAVTYNVNAVLYNDDLHNLLFPEAEYKDYDLIAIALEEVIELTPSKVMTIDLRTRNFWEKKFKQTLNKQHTKEYTLIRGEQLGGVLLLVYANSKTVDNIKNVETSVKKTGFKGISANKGGVAITFTFSTHSRICFVASHLAAGQNNSEERHQNYKTISNGLTFKKCKNIKDSDILIWMGDLNYRINAPNDIVRRKLKCHTPTNWVMNNSHESFISNDSSNIEDIQLNNAEDEKNSKKSQKNEIEKEKIIKQDDGEKTDIFKNVGAIITKGAEDGNIANNDNKSRINEIDSDEETNNETIDETFKKEDTLKPQTTYKIEDIANKNKSSVSISSEKFENSSDKKKLFYNIDETYTQLSINEQAKVISELFEFDQLNDQMARGQTFPYFDEMEICFKPTYKFDKGTDFYDTSEKQRVPSWTDRILTYTKNKNVTSLAQLIYNSIPQYKFSDHKPVYGIFNAELEIIDDHAKSKIEKELYEKAKEEFYAYETTNDSIFSPIFIAKLVSNYKTGKASKDKLPAPSSKNTRWWIAKDGDSVIKEGKVGKVKISFPELESGDYIINPKLPRNPFIKTNEPLFISKNKILE